MNNSYAHWSGSPTCQSQTSLRFPRAPHISLEAASARANLQLAGVECIRKAETTTSTITTGKRATSLRIPSHLKRNNEVAEMAKASKKHVGPGSHGKSDGSGAMTDIELENLPEDAVLSNRDKANHTFGTRHGR